MPDSELPLVEALRARGPLPESLFDGLLPRRLSGMSSVHWTPLDVAARVASLLSPGPGQRVLDVGSGVGKLCIVGALLTEGTWVGVDHNEDCSRAALEIANVVGATRAEFIYADAFSIDWRSFDAIYFFNPFGEVDDEHDRARHDEFARKTFERLEKMRKGTRVVVYFDAGTELPPTYELQRSEEMGGHTLSVWMQRGAT